MSAASFPLAHHEITFSDEISGAPEVQIGKRGPKIGHEGFDSITAAAPCMQRVFEQRIGGGDLVDDAKIYFPAPEFGEPALNYR